MIERAVVLAEGDIIRNEDLELWDSKETASNNIIERIPLNAEELKEMKRHIRDHAIESLESLFVRNALERNNWNVTKGSRRDWNIETELPEHDEKTRNFVKGHFEGSL